MKWKMTFFAVVGTLILGWIIDSKVNHIQLLKSENVALNNQISTLQTINNITQSLISLNYQISLDNIKAKQLEDSEHVKVKTVIKTVLKDNECANADVSSELTNGLRKYERDLRARAASADTRTLNR
ncbi:TPA: hypothetical protein RG734_002214 [Providencia stuartii]|uniref:hypothetical protein n=1 Tax=Providencia TaxID=586 RepID=UPI00234B88B9|nr:hypothetical protein [Providencia stuartii]